MLWAKCLVLGVGGALIALALWMFGVVVFPIAVPLLLSRTPDTAGIGAVSVSSGSMLLVAAIGFVVSAGAAWRSLREV